MDAVLAMVGVLGIDPRVSPWRESTRELAHAQRALAILVTQALEHRAQARTAADFRTADRIRDELDAAGIVLNDGQSGTTWHVAGADTS